MLGPVLRGEAGAGTRILFTLALTVVIFAVWFLVVRRRGIARLLGQAGLPTSPEGWQAWQEKWQAEQEERRQEKIRRREARKQGDRAYYCAELPNATAERRETPIDEDKLKRLGLPVLHTERELADWLGISLPRLRWFTFHKPVDRTSHYVRYTIPKRSGGRRVILAPKRDLKRLQRGDSMISKRCKDRACHCLKNMFVGRVGGSKSNYYSNYRFNKAISELPQMLSKRHWLVLVFRHLGLLLRLFGRLLLDR